MLEKNQTRGESKGMREEIEENNDEQRQPKEDSRGWAAVGMM